MPQPRLPASAAPLAILLLGALATLPWLPLRSFIYEEGANAVLARDILARGDLIHPATFGVPWVEKPSVLAWLIAGVSALTGGVSEWSARLPAIVASMATTLMVWRLVRRYASASAAMFAGLAFLFCPMLLQKLAIAEPDTLICSLSFAAFTVWWDGAETGRVALWRWLACGALLTALVMAKGPQPAGYFALGVSAYTALHRRWRDAPGLILCFAMPVAALVAWAAANYAPGSERVWLGYMRVGNAFDPLKNLRTAGVLALELLPALLLAPFAPWPWRKGRTDAVPVVEPLLLYSTLTTAALLLWPGSAGRYAMPIAPSVAALAGLAWDRMGQGRRLVLRRTGAIALGCLIVAQLAMTLVVPPLFAGKFGQSRAAGRSLEAAVQAAPAPLYCAAAGLRQPDTNQLFYARLPFRCIAPDVAARLPAPFWFEATTGELDDLAKARPDLMVTRRVATPYGPLFAAARFDRR